MELREVLTSQYEDESEAIEDIVIGSEILMPIIESLFESVLAADVKPIMIPTPKRKLRQSDPKEDHEDPDLCLIKKLSTCVFIVNRTRRVEKRDRRAEVPEDQRYQ